jgi:hypothetical protein
VTYCKRRPTTLSAKSTSQHRLSGAAAAGLKFLARATGAGVVAAGGFLNTLDGLLLHRLFEDGLGHYGSLLCALFSGLEIFGACFKLGS